MFRFFVHYGIHFVAPVILAYCFFKEKRLFVLLVFWAAILIDIDHLFASPVYDANRCSIAFHPLHSYVAIAIYTLLLVPKKTRVFGWALLLHIAADYIDCLLIGY